MTTPPESPGIHEAPKDAGTPSDAVAGTAVSEYLVPVVVAIFITLFLWLVSTYNFALYHTTVEFATIAISVAIFLLVWRSRKIIDNHYLLFIGFTFIFIAVLDFLHTLVYQGVGIFPDGGGVLSTRFWIAARYMQAITLLAAPLFIRRNLRIDIVAIVYLAADIIIVSSILIFHNFPVTYIPGTGLTPFKVISEYIISLLLIGSILLLWRNRSSFDRQVLNNLVIAIFLTIAAELTFTEYASFTDIFSLLGHVFRLVSYYFFYRAIIVVGQEKPYNLLYRNLTESEKKYRGLSDLSPDAIIVVQDGVIRYTNEAGSRMSGVPAPELIGRRLEDFVHPDDRETSVARIKAVQHEQVISPLRELNVVAGERITPVEATACPISWEGNHAAQVVIRDITDRKKTEDELTRKNIDLNALNEELTATQDELQLNIDELTRSDSKLRETTMRLESLYSSMNEGLAIHDIVYTGGEATDYIIRDVNPAFENITGIKKADAINRRASELYGTGIPPFIDVYARVASGRGPEHFETYFPPMDKHLSISVFSPEKGTFATVFGDITGRREKEDILRLTGEVYSFSADQTDLSSILAEYARLLQRFTGCDSIGIRLLDEEGNIPYHANIGFSEDFYNRESPLSIRSHHCMCINVITGTTDPALPFYTEGGSFCINATTKFLSTVSEEDKGKTRNICNQAGYESVALIPIRRGETILGLLHLADHREGMVPERIVRILETVAFAMGSQIMRLKAEESLSETSQYLENLITYANAPIIVWDPSFRITRFNQAFEELTGLRSGEVIGQPLSILFPDKFRAPSMEVIRRTMQGERLNVVEIPIIRKDGDVRIVLWNSATLFGPDGTTIASTIAQGQDITERKIAEAENIRARAEWERTFNTVPDLIAILDPHHRIIRVNKAMADRLGTTPDQCIGKRCHEAVHGTPVPPEFCPHSKTCADGQQHIEEVHEPGLGGTFIVSTTPLCDPAGNLLGTVHVAHDISDRKRAEEELRRQHEDLSAAYEQIAATQEELQQNVEELSSRESQLQEALDEKEILLSEIHHRVKNNLTAFISLLSLEGAYEDTESGRALKKDLQNRARSMALIHETLYRTRKFSNVEMETYLATLVSQIAGSYASHVSVRTIVEAHEASLDLGRATTAGLIINELVTNSFKYAFPPGFDCMAERGEPCTIRITLAPADGTYVLTVADNGKGLPPGLDPLSTRSLGLKLVNFLARHQLRAEVEVRSERGTAFIFHLENTEEI